MTKRPLAAKVLALSTLLGLAGMVQAAAAAKVECGFFEYVAPDGLTAGSIEFAGAPTLG